MKLKIAAHFIYPLSCDPRTRFVKSLPMKSYILLVGIFCVSSLFAEDNFKKVLCPDEVGRFASPKMAAYGEDAERLRIPDEHVMEYSIRRASTEYLQSKFAAALQELSAAHNLMDGPLNDDVLTALVTLSQADKVQPRLVDEMRGEVLRIALAGGVNIKIAPESTESYAFILDLIPAESSVSSARQEDWFDLIVIRTYLAGQRANWYSARLTVELGTDILKLSDNAKETDQVREAMLLSGVYLPIAKHAGKRSLELTRELRKLKDSIVDYEKLGSELLGSRNVPESVRQELFYELDFCFGHKIPLSPWAKLFIKRLREYYAE